MVRSRFEQEYSVRSSAFIALYKKVFSSSYNSLSRYIALLAITIGLVLAGWRINMLSFFSYDDTFIILRYAANFLSHGQFVWNVGEAAVEGYTSPLQLFMVTALGAAGIDLLLAARIVSLGFYGGTVFLLGYGLAKIIGWRWAVFAAALLAASPSFIAWGWGAMETTLNVFLLTLGHVLVLYAIYNRKENDKTILWCGLAFALAGLTRLDAMVFALPAGVFWLCCAWPNVKHAVRNAVLFSLPSVVLLGAHFIWRNMVYGEWLPNTFYTKVPGAKAASISNGLDYFFSGFAAPSPLYAAGFAAMLLLLFNKNLRSFALYALAAYALTLAYICWVGGDFMPGWRFLLPLLPLAVMALTLAASHMAGRWQQAGVAVLFILLCTHFALPTNLRNIDATGPIGLNTGAYIALSWPAGSLIALNPAGAIPYQNLDKNFVDMLGLNDRVISRRAVPDLGLPWQNVVGHAKGDGAYVLRRQPDYIILSSVAGDSAPETPVFVSDAEMRGMDEFKNCYAREQVRIPWPESVRNSKTISGDDFKFTYYRRVCGKN